MAREAVTRSNMRLHRNGVAAEDHGRMQCSAVQWNAVDSRIIRGYVVLHRTGTVLQAHPLYEPVGALR